MFYIIKSIFFFYLEIFANSLWRSQSLEMSVLAHAVKTRCYCKRFIRYFRRLPRGYEGTCTPGGCGLHILKFESGQFGAC